jgi:hypothetical protein
VTKLPEADATGNFKLITGAMCYGVNSVNSGRVTGVAYYGPDRSDNTIEADLVLLSPFIYDNTFSASRPLAPAQSAVISSAPSSASSGTRIQGRRRGEVLTVAITDHNTTMKRTNRPLLGCSRSAYRRFSRVLKPSASAYLVHLFSERRNPSLLKPALKISRA